MQPTRQFHDGIGIAGPDVSEHLFDDAASFHPGDHLLDHLVADLFIMLFAFVGVTQVFDLAILRTGHQVVFHAMGFFLPL